MIVYFVMVYLLITNNITNKSQIQRLVSTFLIGGFLVALFGVVQYLISNICGTEALVSMGFDRSTYFFGRSREGFRAFSIFYHYNVFGGFLALVLPLAITVPRNLRIRIATVVMFMALILTYSRGSWLGVIGVIIVISVIKKSLRVFCEAGICAILAILFLCMLSGSFFNKVTARATDTYSSVNSRFLLWQAGWEMISSHPLTGVGIGTFAENLPLYAPPNIEMQDTAHNLYLNIAAETGIPGLFLYLAILSIILYRGIKNHQTLKDKYLKYLNLGLLGGVIAFSVNNLFTPLMLRGVAIPLWIFIGLIMVIRRLYPNKSGFQQTK